MSEGSNGNMRGGKREEDCSNKLEEKNEFLKTIKKEVKKL